MYYTMPCVSDNLCLLTQLTHKPVIWSAPNVVPCQMVGVPVLLSQPFRVPGKQPAICR